ncbi:MAG: hypothetical protein ACRC5Q_01275 [Culicoidibacterales bacterium]
MKKALGKFVLIVIILIGITIIGVNVCPEVEAVIHRLTGWY